MYMCTGISYHRHPYRTDPTTTGTTIAPPPREQVTAAGVRALLESLRLSDDSGDRLSCLELDFNPLGDAGAQPLPAYLKERASRGGGGLEELSLRFCDIGPAGCRWFGLARWFLVFDGIYGIDICCILVGTCSMLI